MWHAFLLKVDGKRLPCPAREGGAVMRQHDCGGRPPSDPAVPGHLPHLAYAKQGRLFFSTGGGGTVDFGPSTPTPNRHPFCRN